ncbi:MAG: farnesyl diphosphate synthase [Acutalibacteraceae bacterium]|nr:farnesyl diphosphate synthase [Acutalibacteraceae bacterium]
MINLEILEKRLIDNIINDKLKYAEILTDAMVYSVSAGGKRIRPQLVFECYKLFSNNEDLVLDAACALEYIHTYSLIHDDLPCMDNDDYRRGKPSCHKKYGEDIALLAGDALLTLAFKVILNCKVDADRMIKAVSVLSDFIGMKGMVGGQIIDLQSENKKVSLDVVLKTYELKTSALIQAACMVGAVLGGANDKQLSKISDYAYNLGIAFQIKDDILDVIGSAEKLGKPIGSDDSNNKSTYVSLVCMDNAQKAVLEYSNKAKESIAVFGEKAEFLNNLVDKLIVREN